MSLMVQPAPRMSTAPTPNRDSICQSGKQPGSAAKPMLQVHGRYSSHVPGGRQNPRVGARRETRSVGAAGQGGSRVTARPSSQANPLAKPSARSEGARGQGGVATATGTVPATPPLPPARRGRHHPRPPAGSARRGPRPRHGGRVAMATAPARPAPLTGRLVQPHEAQVRLQRARRGAHQLGRRKAERPRRSGRRGGAAQRREGTGGGKGQTGGAEAGGAPAEPRQERRHLAAALPA